MRHRHLTLDSAGCTLADAFFPSPTRIEPSPSAGCHPCALSTPPSLCFNVGDAWARIGHRDSFSSLGSRHSQFLASALVSSRALFDLGVKAAIVIVWCIRTCCGVVLWLDSHSFRYLLASATGANLVCGKSNVNPQSRDLVLQLVERILSGPKAQTIMLNGAVRKGERIVPPAVLDLLMRATFPASTARVKTTERFETFYPTLKELALTGYASCSYCYLLPIPPMLRKYGFHLVLSGNRYYISNQGDFLEIDEQWQSRPRGGRKRKCPSIGSFCRKRIVSPEQASTLMYNVLWNMMQAEFCWWDEKE
ncbi:hypothetical protein ZIOFF_073088 [Zingiber officinale]|uniref:Uncharacterized protein n=1 Tax=Zingiber officinale TaxID=94328 RepID=A0A8J5EM60_ZINOF|nr:hypothetical protein ZIOFF_073088 [Zingiber officinale]